MVCKKEKLASASFAKLQFWTGSKWHHYKDQKCSKESMLLDRMVFVETLDGEKVATATAYLDPADQGDPYRGQLGEGWLHWVAVRKGYQGKGLSKPLIAYVLQIMAGHGHTHVKVPTRPPPGWPVSCIWISDFGLRRKMPGRFWPTWAKT